ncbi:UNVERIFIED_CONTAM: hypothetical protein Slati_0847500 [Sesamum latifolium]|uniref:Integrase zinc-binding domain-containing protein n=1 Tax=Sesamum latifolium TaxID=2727402 RepID=A0AAW2XLU1_9LAMI
MAYHCAASASTTNPTGYPAHLIKKNDWRTPIIRWIDEGHLPGDRWEATKTKNSPIRFLMQGGMLYKKSFTHPLLRCLSQEEGLHVLKEIHDGCCGSHIGTWALVNKALRAGYFWPTMKQDARYLVNKCEKCQRHATFISMGHGHSGTIPTSTWAEEISLGCHRLLHKMGGSRTPCPYHGRESHETHMEKYHMSLRANEQVEVTNRILVQGIKKRLDRARDTWLEELTSILWSYRTTPKGSTGESPFTLVYGTEAIIPAELGMPSHRILHFDEEHNSQLLKENLDLVDEPHETAFIRTERYKRR